MKFSTKTDCERKVATTGPIGSEGMMDDTHSGWQRLFHDLVNDDTFGRAREAMAHAASQVDLVAETTRMLANQMLPALRHQ